MADLRIGWNPPLPRQAAGWWLAAGLLAVGAWLTGHMLAAAGAQAPDVAAGLLVGVASTPYLLVIYWLDPIVRKPISLLAGALIWGGSAALVVFQPAGMALGGLLPKLGSLQLTQAWGPAITAPPFEEAGKLLGVVLLALVARSSFHSPLDGMVYGAMVGLGFNLVETAVYLLDVAAQTQGSGQAGAVFGQFVTRMGVGGLTTHVAFTAISGWGVAYLLTQTRQPRVRRRAVAAGLFLVPVGLHVGQNADPTKNAIDSRFGGVPVWELFLGVLTIALLVGLYVLGVRIQRRQLRHAAASGLLTPAELDALTSRRARHRARQQARATSGRPGDRLATELQHTQLALAVRLAHGTDHDDPALQRLQRNALTLRQELRAAAGRPHDPATTAPHDTSTTPHQPP